MKRKTLHLQQGLWEKDYPMAYLTDMTSRLKSWHYWFQTFGTVTYCGLRVHTLDKLADHPGQATCRACRDRIALHLLANT